MTSTATQPQTPSQADFDTAIDSLYSPDKHLLCPTCFPAPIVGQMLIAVCGHRRVFTGFRDSADGSVCFDCAVIEAQYGGVEGGCPMCG